MFKIVQASIDTQRAREGLRDVASGAYASFEGWVRNHHEGRGVSSLEYHAYPRLALAEGEKILSSALKKFPVSRVACIHRTGTLGWGELAVWVGVCSHHRGEAFQACKYIIDEVKHRVPIWKKEFYTDGTSEWVRCEGCQNAEHEHEHEHDHGLELHVRDTPSDHSKG